jgi:HSP20 family protein
MWSLMPWKQTDNSQSRNLTAEPFEHEFLRLRNDFDRLMHSIWNGRDGELGSLWGTSFDETDTHYIHSIEAPGFEPGDFEVQTSGDRLVVKAERKASEEGQHLRRYSFGSLQRTIRLPACAEKDGIDAHYRNGILELRIPKNSQAQDVKRIAVKSA